MAVKIPLSVSPREAYAPCSIPCSMAAEVPTAWDAVPREMPCEDGMPMWPYFKIRKPVMAPKMPTKTTIVAVSDGMPPMLWVTSMAIGVVTDLAARDRTTSLEAPKYWASMTTDTIPTMQPTNCDMNIGIISCLMECSCL